MTLLKVICQDTDLRDVHFWLVFVRVNWWSLFKSWPVDILPLPSPPTPPLLPQTPTPPPATPPTPHVLVLKLWWFIVADKCIGIRTEPASKRKKKFCLSFSIVFAVVSSVYKTKLSGYIIETRTVRTLHKYILGRYICANSRLSLRRWRTLIGKRKSIDFGLRLGLIWKLLKYSIHTELKFLLENIF